ncbi:MAG: PDZ domain-containing protein [Propionibacteriaceae bacterium]|nr:PDZ domain-containing protein [Propionibacteriaceae bacterium]
MSKQTWTVAVSGLLFVVLVLLTGLLPTPYVTWLPGGTYNLLASDSGDEAIRLSGITTYQHDGQLRMTTVALTAVQAQTTLPQVIAAYWLPDREVIPREAVYPTGVSTTVITSNNAAMMTSAQTNAVVAALLAAKVPVSEYPMVLAVSSSGPSYDVLLPGDLILKVDDAPTTTIQQVSEALAKHYVGDAVVVTVLRAGISIRKTISTRASAKQPEVASIGVSLGVGYEYYPNVEFGIESNIGGSSAGLMMALAIYSKITPVDIVHGHIIAGTGQIDARGNVSSIGGVREKIAAARRDGASIFLLPLANCTDVDNVADMQLVPVTSLNEAITFLGMLNQSNLRLPSC